MRLPSTIQNTTRGYGIASLPETRNLSPSPRKLRTLIPIRLKAGEKEREEGR